MTPDPQFTDAEVEALAEADANFGELYVRRDVVDDRHNVAASLVRRGLLEHTHGIAILGDVYHLTGAGREMAAGIAAGMNAATADINTVLDLLGPPPAEETR
jgi:hypothetical protein